MQYFFQNTVGENIIDVPNMRKNMRPSNFKYSNNKKISLLFAIQFKSVKERKLLLLQELE